jgi:nucleotide-binding universal stress UspA family protein
MFEKILVAVDGSKHSDAAFDVAVEMTRRFGSNLIVLHVFQGSTGPILVVSSAEEDTLKNEGETILNSYEKKIENLGLPNAIVLLAKGDAAKRTLDTAKEQQCGLIVIGRKGKGMWDELLLGNVSQKVVEHAKCPVLVVG